MSALRSSSCVRARESISLELDGESSQFESTLTASHIRRCAECASFAEHLRAATDALRAEPLERLATPVVLPRRSHGALARSLPGVSAVAAAAALAAFVLTHQPVPAGDEREGALVGAPLVHANSVDELVIEVRRRDLERGRLPVVASPTGGLGTFKPPLGASAA